MLKSLKRVTTPVKRFDPEQLKNIDLGIIKLKNTDSSIGVIGMSGMQM